MTKVLNLISVDLGASSGRVILVTIADNQIIMSETHRFDNHVSRFPPVNGPWCWNIRDLWEHIKHGIREARNQVDHIDSIGVDSWGVDYALLNKEGDYVHHPVAYRDPRTNVIYDQTIEKLGRDRIYSHTGIQFMPINTLYQLAYEAGDPNRPLDHASTMLMIPQLISYWLTGRRVAEHTLASTTQLYDTQSGQWVDELLQGIGVPKDFMPEVVQPGTVIGTLMPDVASELLLPEDTPVIAVGSHDTASSVAATPLENEQSAYLSSGTWSLLGLELDEPCRSSKALAANFTNEAGVAGKTRFLKNMPGLWLLQECRRIWSEEGKPYSYSDLTDLAAVCDPFVTLINPEDPRYTQPGDMPALIREACIETGQAPPKTPGTVARCILDSLALCFNETLENASAITGRSIDTLHIVGGGCQNILLNQITANTTDRRIVAGPVEATAVGNALVQAIALGSVEDLTEARRLVVNSFSPIEYTPNSMTPERIHFARRRFVSLRSLTGIRQMGQP